MTDAEMQRLGQIVADEVYQRAFDQIETWCVRTFVVMITFWTLRIAFLFLRDLKKEMQK